MPLEDIDYLDVDRVYANDSLFDRIFNRKKALEQPKSECPHRPKYDRKDGWVCEKCGLLLGGSDITVTPSTGEKIRGSNITAKKIKNMGEMRKMAQISEGPRKVNRSFTFTNDGYGAQVLDEDRMDNNNIEDYPTSKEIYARTKNIKVKSHIRKIGKKKIKVKGYKKEIKTVKIKSKKTKVRK